jgi:CheY-like chemotaxis protein
MDNPPASVLSGRRLLVVEDEYFVADDIARSLQHLGAEVLGPVPSHVEALDLVSSGERIDLAVLDINLRGEMIFPVAEALQARGIPFLFATGYDCTSVPQQYVAVPCWHKPFDPDELAQALPGLIR